MYLAYYDEAGDDGYPKFSSPIFVLTSCYFHYLHWKNGYDALHQLRRLLKDDFGFPVKTEMHTKQFVMNKNPYAKLNLSDEKRLEVMDKFCDFIAQLNLRIVNTVIVKPRIRKQDYPVLDTAFKYSIQRIENDLDPLRNPDNKFLIITDPGRVGKMRLTSRRIQRINFIPSKYGPASYRKEISALIEDPLPKDSKESYYIQLSDLVSYVVYLYSILKTASGKLPNRLPPKVDAEKVEDWMERLKPCFNLQAAPSDPYGIVWHPK